MQEIKEILSLSSSAKQWDKVGIRPHHGVLIPLSSIHTKNSCGIGEFLDLIPLIDWCARAGFDFLQLLPLNLSDSDPSPYNIESSCALSEAHLSLWNLPQIENFSELKQELAPLQALTRLS